MRILIQNYASPISSEPLYLNQTFSTAEGIESHLWSPSSMSVFDVFDRFKPNVFVCHYLGVSNEIISYIAQNNDIKLAVNITNIDEQDLSTLEKLLTENKITCSVMFSNNYDFIDQCKPEVFKYEKLLPCADIYFAPSDIPDYKLQAGMIASSQSEELTKLEEKFDSYHKMKIGVEQDDNFDINTNVIMLASLYSKYEEIVICDSVDVAFSQIFFDAFLKSEKVSVKLPNDQQHFFTKALSEIFKEEEGEDMISKIKNQIKENHTCVNRARQLLEAIV